MKNKIKRIYGALLFAASLVMFGCRNNVDAKPDANIADTSSGQTDGSGNGQLPTVFDSKEYKADGVKFTMITIPAVTNVTLGADGQENNPRHTVTLTAYRIGETEVTQELWMTVMDKNPSYFDNTGIKSYVNNEGIKYDRDTTPAAGEIQEKRPVGFTFSMQG